MTSPTMDAAKCEALQKLLGDTIVDVFREFLLPRVKYDAHFDLRREYVERIQQFFERDELIAAVPDAVHQILEELKPFPLYPPASN